MGAHPRSSGVLVDFSEPMIGAAEERLHRFRGRWRYVRADLSQPGWRDVLPADERFDAVVSGFCIYHLPDERKRGPPPPEEVAQAFHEREVAEQDILLDVETQCRWLREIGFEQVDSYFKLPEIAIFGGVKRS
jgi:hypothetical protein